ncbi:hypothetical protein ACWFQ8_08570 [Streptomyces sp. NPDC055254]
MTARTAGPAGPPRGWIQDSPVRGAAVEGGTLLVRALGAPAWIMITACAVQRSFRREPRR